MLFLAYRGRRGDLLPHRKTKATGTLSKIILEIEIDAPPQRVWDVLTDFPSYLRWNPYQVFRGEVKLYGFVEIESRGLDGRPFKPFRSAIWRLEKASRLELLTGKLFWNASRRVFRLTPTASGTRLTHGIIFSGLGALFLAPDDAELQKLRPLYESFAYALKRTAESGVKRRTSRNPRLQSESEATS